MLNEILKNYTMIQEIWQHHRESLMMSRILRREGIENSGSSEPLQPILSLYSSEKSRRHISLCLSLAMPWVFCSQVAWQFRVYLTPQMHLQNSLTKRNFKAGSWISEQKFAERRRISHQENQRRQLDGGSHQSEINCWKRSLILKSYVWCWQQNWNGAAILLIWSTGLPSVESWQEKRAKKSYSERKTEECFQRKTLGSCSIRDAS